MLLDTSTTTRSIKPVKKKILVRKCLAFEPEKHDGRIWYKADNVVVTDMRGVFSYWAEIIDVADDCELFKKEDIGAFVTLPEYNPQNLTRVNSYYDEHGVPVDEFIATEKLFLIPTGSKPIIAR